MKKQYNGILISFFTPSSEQVFDLCTSSESTGGGPVYSIHGNDNCGRDIW